MAARDIHSELVAHQTFKRMTRRIRTLENAIHSLLNIEGAALTGGQLGAWKGLDVHWHFTKARKALGKRNRKDGE